MLHPGIAFLPGVTIMCNGSRDVGGAGDTGANRARLLRMGALQHDRRHVAER